MTQQIINVGNAVNDGTGESLRSAFQAVNDNFSNVWAAGPVDSQVVIRNNVVSTNLTNRNLVLAANGVGVITVATTVVPSISSVFDLGTANNQFDSVYARYYYGNAARMTGLPEPANLLAVTTDILPVASQAFDLGSGSQRWNSVYARDGNFSRNVTVSGNLTVMGDVIEMGNSVTDSLRLQLANSAVTSAAANGAGITVGASDNIATVLYDSANNVWTTNIGVSVDGAITGTSVAVSDATVYGNVDAINGNFTGNVSADYFIGDGSLLTGLPAGYANADAVAYGESGWAGNIVPSANVTYSLGNSTNQWKDLWVSNSTIYINSVPVTIDGTTLQVNGSNVVTAAANGTVDLANLAVDNNNIYNTQGQGVVISNFSFIDEAETAYVQIPAGNSASDLSVVQTQGNVRIASNGADWTFGTDGLLTLPSGNVAIGLQYGSEAILATNTSFGVATQGNATTFLNWSDDVANTSVLSAIYINDPSGNTGDIAIRTGAVGNAYVWRFEQTGNLTLPSGGSVYSDSFTPSGAPGNTIVLNPHGSGSITNQKLMVYPTAADGDHIHMATGNLYETELFLGNDNFYVKLANTGNVVINSNDNTGNIASWTFGSNGSTIFPTLTVDLHNGGNQSAQTLQFGDTTQQAVITGPAPAPDTAAQRLIIQGQRGNGLGEGGDVYLWAGDAEFNGGDIKIYAGDADDAAAGSGGYINLDGGSGFNGGGQISITGGYSPGGQGGPVYISAGQGTDGGVVNINGGGASTATGGYVNIQGGFGQGDGGAVTIAGGGSALGLPGYGNVQITAGVSTWTFDNAGVLNLPGGTGTIESTANNISIYSDAGQLNGALFYDTGAEIYALQDFAIFTDNANASHIWRFYANGNMTAPGAINVGNMVIGTVPGDITADANTGVTFNVSGPDGGFAVNYLDEVGNANTSGGELAFSSETGNATYRISLSDDLGNGFATKIWRFDGTGTFSAPGNVSATYFIGDGSQLTGLPASYSDSNVASFLATFGSNTVSTTGNITAGNFIGSGANVDIAAGSYDWTFGNDGNLTLPGNTFAVNYANGVTVSLAGTYGNSNVTTLLSSLGANSISTTGNVSANYLVGNGSQLTSVNAATVDILNTNGLGTTFYPTFVENRDSAEIVRADVDLTYRTDTNTLGVGNVSATNITLSGTGTAVNASGGNILTNQVTGTQFNFLNGLYTAKLNAGGATANYTLSLPANTGSNGQVLTTDGTGALSWSTPASTYGNSNVATFLASYGSNTISTSGNITAGNLIGNISITGNVTGTSANVTLMASTYSWTFDNTGNLALPGNTFAVNYANGTAVSLGGNYGNANVVANLAALGSNPVSTTGNVTSGNLITAGTATTGVNALLAGPSFTPLANTSAGFVANVNSYSQVTFQNKNTGADATADYILTADNGSDSVNYGDFGIINSGYDVNTPTNSLGNIVRAADTYLYAQGNVSNTAQSGGNLVIGTATAGKTVKIFAGGNTASALVANISNTGVSVAGNVTASNFIGNISITGNIQGTTPNVSLVAGSYTMTFDNTGILTLPAVGGSEGGEINLGIPTANTTLLTAVKFDVYQDRIRFFDGSTKGVYIDLSQAATGVGTMLNNRVSGLVNAGTFVTMDNIKATVTSSAPRGLSLATVSGSFSYNIGGNFALAGGPGGSVLAGQTLTTTPTSSIFGWGFSTSGDLSTYILTDTTNSRCYRITVQIGASFNNNSIVIERLI